MKQSPYRSKLASSMAGAALLMALLAVGVIAFLASFGLWQQQRTLSVEKAERDAQQAIFTAIWVPSIFTFGIYFKLCALMASKQ